MSGDIDCNDCGGGGCDHCGGSGQEPVYDEIEPAAVRMLDQVQNGFILPCGCEWVYTTTDGIDSWRCRDHPRSKSGKPRK